MFTIAGRPAANVSNSLFGELVASTGTSLKMVRQASERGGQRGHLLLARGGPREHDVGRRRGARARRRRLPSPSSTKRHVGQQPRRLDRLGQVVGLAHRAEVADRRTRSPAGGSGVGLEQVEVGGVRHQHHLSRRHAGGDHAVADAGRERDHPRGRAGRPAARAPAPGAASRGLLQRAHLDRRLRPQVAHLEHERRAPARGGRERRARRSSAAARSRRPRPGGDRAAAAAVAAGGEAREGEHAVAGPRWRWRSRSRSRRPARPPRRCRRPRLCARTGGYHPHPVPPRDEAARELVGARAAHSRAGDEELVQVEDLHR